MPNKQTCFTSLENQLVEELGFKRTEAQEFSDEFWRRVKNAEADKTLASTDNLYSKIAGEMADEAKLQALRKKREAAMNFKVRLQIADYVATKYMHNPVKGISTYLIDKVWLRQHSLGNKYLGGFVTELEQKNLLAPLVKGELDREISQELFALDKQDFRGRDSNGTVTGSKTAHEIARVMHDWQETARRMANDRGAYIKNLPGYIVKQSHDVYEMLPKFDFKTMSRETKEQAFQRWRNTILPLLDHDLTFKDIEDPENFLRGTYNAFLSGDHMKAGESQGMGFIGASNIAKKLGKERSLHFKDGNAWHEYNQVFGVGNLREAYMEGLARMAHMTAALETLGSNPTDTLSRVVRDFRFKMKSTDNLKAIEALSGSSHINGIPKPIANLLSEINGDTKVPANRMWAKIWATARSIESMAKLGGAMLSSFSDLAVYAGEAHYQGRGLFTGYAEALTALMRGKSPQETKQISSMIGTFSDALRGNIGMRFTAHDDVPGRVSNTMQLFFKMNGLRWWTDTLKEAASLSMSHRLAQLKLHGWNDLDASLTKVLDKYGIEEAHWDLIRQASSKEADGKEYLLPDAVQRIDDKIIMNKFNLSDKQVQRFKDDLEMNIRSYYIDRAQRAVLEPSIEERAFMRQGTKPGSFEGELLRTVFQFKAYPLSFINKVLRRDVDEIAGHIRNRDLFENGKGAMLGLTNTIIMTTVLGYMSMLAKDITKGKTPRLPTDDTGHNIDLARAALVQGGVLGIYGDFLFGEASRFGHSPLETLAGPVPTTAADIINLWQTWRDTSNDDMGNGKRAAAAKTFKLFLDNVPAVGLLVPGGGVLQNAASMANLFYVRPLLDWLVFYQVQEAINPGFLQRMERRMKKQNNQEFFVPPSEVFEH